MRKPKKCETCGGTGFETGKMRIIIGTCPDCEGSGEIAKRTGMKAITLHQPYASLIAWGAKTFETRSWKTEHRGVLAIHAGQTLVRDWHPTYSAEFWRVAGGKGITDLAEIPYGAIVAVVDLTWCEPTKNWFNAPWLSDIDRHFGDWSEGRYAWRLADIRPLAMVVPAKGKQGIWYLEPEDELRVISQLDSVDDPAVQTGWMI